MRPIYCVPAAEVTHSLLSVHLECVVVEHYITLPVILHQTPTHSDSSYLVASNSHMFAK